MFSVNYFCRRVPSLRNVTETLALGVRFTMSVIKFSYELLICSKAALNSSACGQRDLPTLIAPPPFAEDISFACWSRAALCLPTAVCERHDILACVLAAGRTRTFRP